MNNVNERMPVRYPVGIQSFEKLRTEGYLYVDKTLHIRRLVEMGNPYFLSRPRRFGKSLLLSTIEAYFLGKKELFRGLAIDQWEKDWKAYPVLHFSLNAEKYETVEDLENMLEVQLSTWESEYDVHSLVDSYAIRFKTVIQKAYEKTGLRVVVLIDEYDKPLLRVMHNEELQVRYRNLLTAFYTVLKDADPFLHFVFITGVTKFAQMGIFSNLNQLMDISFDEDFADLCGLTRQEIMDTFPIGLSSLAAKNKLTEEEALDKLTQLYDGYHFSPYNTVGVYNPFSILQALSKNVYGMYWFASGTPTFLVEMLKETDFDIRNLEGIKIDDSTLTNDRADMSNPIPMIYQSGYLTIKSYDEEFRIYTLGFPNEEVRYGFLSFAAPYYGSVPRESTAFHIGCFIKELRAGETDSFLNRLKAFFADFPYELSDKSERHYQVVFYLVFKLMGQFTQTEVQSARGRADAVVWTPDYIYVFEFKLNGSAEEALEQIDDKGYLIPYTADERKLIKVGVSFDKQKRNLDKWLVL
ncbi:ATP-binding protein [Bacteroides sp. OttesenSCG-928-E20]|nr:ATP-binding protein [Bacteroides sp. OttesenSCG-928-N06]MDL2299499.1 ATP-binding protein [Bacteroides sp. OttesenSCG-928-E20]MDL2304662.1 ATP-binding protein [Bacteroides sp. OttesenSCG-928-D19]